MPRPRVYFIGNTHIDHTWVWNWPEGFDEVHASFRAALDRMEEFPEFVFTASSTLHYRWVEENDPGLFAEIRRRVEEGRWQLAGGWVVQSDNNIPCGEAFVRQGLHGQHYFQSRFGRRAQVGYCVDSFGHHLQLPQILQGQGMTGWLHFRPTREERSLPEGPYRWRGLDGTEVIACRPPGWYCTPNDEWFANAVKALPEMHRHYPEALLFYGVGDHGGGPTLRDLNRLRPFAEGHPELECLWGGLDEFYARAAAAAESLPVVEHDLQYTFRGCYSSDSVTKSLNRRAEARLLAGETMAALAAMAAAPGEELPYPTDEIHAAWEHVLINGFHDVLCGTCAQVSQDEACLRYGAALEAADRVRHHAFKRLTRRFDRRPPAGYDSSLAVCLGNSLSHERREPVSFYGFMIGRGMPHPAVVDGEGRHLDFQRVEPEFGTPDWAHGMLVDAATPAGGVAVVHLVNNPERAPVATDLDASPTALHSGSWSVEVNSERGGLQSLRHRGLGVELLAPGGIGGELLVIRDLGDTWGSGWSAFREVVGSFRGAGTRLLESGPLRARLEIRSEYERCTARQLLSVYRDLPCVEVALEVHWHERLRMLKIALPLALAGARLVTEIPYGAVERPASGEEQPLQRWLAVSGSVGGAPVTLGLAADTIGACDLLAAEDSAELRLTLLRSPYYGYLTSGIGGLGAWEVVENVDRPIQDQGVRRAVYRLYAGTTLEALGLPRRADELAQPVQVAYEGSQPGGRRAPLALLQCTPEHVSVAALKRAEDGDGFIARLVETAGRPAQVRVAGPEGFPELRASLRPWEIASFRWRRGKAPIRCNLLEEAVEQP